jgi:membrane associated rhomboid family serine protease
MYFPPIFFFRVPAWLVLVWWFATQFLSGLPQLIDPNPEISGGVAVWAHIGGFVAGLVFSRAFEDRALLAEHARYLRLQGYG